MARRSSSAMALVSFETDVGEGGYYGELQFQGVSPGGSEEAAQYVLSPAQCRALADELKKLTVKLGEPH